MSTHYAEAFARYFAKVDWQERSAEECWPWTGASNGDGYGMIYDILARKWRPATRVGHELRIGPIPDGMVVCHTCDNPPCHNHHHWFLGTVRDNNADRHAKGRTVLPDNRGERHGMSKLTASQIGEIRSRYATGNVSQNALATEFGVRQQQISRIVRGKSWGHENRSSASSS